MSDQRMRPGTDKDRTGFWRGFFSKSPKQWGFLHYIVISLLITTGIVSLDKIREGLSLLTPGTATTTSSDAVWTKEEKKKVLDFVNSATPVIKRLAELGTKLETVTVDYSEKKYSFKEMDRHVDNSIREIDNRINAKVIPRLVALESKE